MSDIHILAIESSCDDTSAAVLKNNRVLSNLIADQSVHQSFGGVVPELASRAHMQNIVPVVHEALSKANIVPEQLNAIACTRGPGLIGSLMVGLSFAKSMAWSLEIPFIEVNHMQAHVLAHFAEAPEPEFPFLCLTVSGGHTQIVLVKAPLDMEVVGTTIDDAAGEAFDKTAKMLGIPYPGGPLIDKYAKGGNPKAFEFPRPKVKDLDFSFSGLKTAILYFLQKQEKKDSGFVQKNLNDICASVQYRIVDYLLYKLKMAAEKYNINQIAIAGGVSANSHLRSELERLGNEQGWQIFIPKFEFCTDNAAMIGVTAYFKYLENDFAGWDTGPTARYGL
ncbi:MAG: tRNA (adenosine(37)-N6)-threonylcarbamoyltransferase complex transferase subunit TsaD [Chitinophagales bacterium]